jgi:hypothetical protein
VCVTEALSVDERVNVMLACPGTHVACNENLTEYSLSKSKVTVTVANI